MMKIVVTAIMLCAAFGLLIVCAIQLAAALVPPTQGVVQLMLVCIFMGVALSAFAEAVVELLKTRKPF